MRQGATDQEVAGNREIAALMRRACIVLTVAALDSYLHERGVELLVAEAGRGTREAGTIAAYLGSVSAGQITGPSAAGYIRYRLSYKTLAAPSRIDELLEAVGVDAGEVWLDISIKAGSRPDRFRRLTDLQYDRRNQIAHEADWDPVAREFRDVRDVHVDECLSHVQTLVTELDMVL